MGTLSRPRFFFILYLCIWLSYRINYHLYTASILWSRILFSKIWIAIKFLGIYLYQLITSSLSIIKYILFKTKDMNPGLLTYETELKSDWAITFLTILIIITPGSTVIRISKLTNKFLFIV